MMICVARGGGGVVVFDVLVLCGAGGGLTVQPETSSITAPSAAPTRLAVPGTPLRVSAGLTAGLGAGFRAGPSGRVELDLADPNHLGRHLHALVAGAELHRLLEVQLQRTGERLDDVGRR